MCASWLRSAGAGALTLALAACGSSAPQQADAPARETVAPETQRAASAPEADSRRERRGERRAADASAEADEPATERRRDRRAADASEAAASDEAIPEALAAAYARALEAMRAANWLEAELELEQLVLEYPHYPGPHVNLALVYLNDERRDDARAALQRALELAPGHAAANTQLGILLREDGNFQEAEAAYRRALATESDHALAHYNLGVLLDIYLRRTAEALEHYEAYQASLLEPNETVARWIIDLRRRVSGGDAARVAQEDGL